MDNKKYFTTASIVSSNRVLYTPSSFARTSLLHLQEIGELQALAPHTSKRDGLQSYLFFTVLSGTGSLTYGDKVYKLEKGDMVFIDCRKAYSHTTSEKLWSLRWCHFYGPTLSFVYEKYVERGGKAVFRATDTAPYLRGDDGNVKCFLHKQSIKTLKAVGAVNEAGCVDIDTGAILFGADVLNSLWAMISKARCDERSTAGKAKESLFRHGYQYMGLQTVVIDRSDNACQNPPRCVKL